MRYSLLFLLICLLLVSCKPSKSRHPISNNSGAFFDASIERNKQLNNREYSLIKTFIQNSEKSFKSTEYGFWYAYNTEIETNSNTPSTRPIFGQGIIMPNKVPKGAKVSSEKASTKLSGAKGVSGNRQAKRKTKRFKKSDN